MSFRSSVTAAALLLSCAVLPVNLTRAQDIAESDTSIKALSIKKLDKLSDFLSQRAKTESFLGENADAQRAFEESARKIDALAEAIKSLTPEDASAKLSSFKIPQEVAELAGILVQPSDRGVANLAPTSLPREAWPELAPPPAATPPDVPILNQETSVEQFVLGLNSATTVDYPAVGALVTKTSTYGPTIFCTGTLIAPDAVLTAAHCLKWKPTGVYFQHAGLITIAELVPHHDYTEADFPKADLAILQLERPVRTIRPVAINNIARLPAGTEATVIGFGWRNALNLNGDPIIPNNTNGGRAAPLIVKLPGLKLHGRIKTITCPGARSLICWNYDWTTIDQGFGSTCHGDSGGPLLVRHRDQWLVAGTTSGGDENCSTGDIPYDVEVFDFLPWIQETLATLPSARSTGSATFADALDGVSNAEERYLALETYYRITNGLPFWSSDVAIPPQTQLIQFSVNGTPSGGGISLKVTSRVDGRTLCNVAAKTTVQDCALTNPGAELLNITVNGAINQEMQVVATRF